MPPSWQAPLCLASHVPASTHQMNAPMPATVSCVEPSSSMLAACPTASALKPWELCPPDTDDPLGPCASAGAVVRCCSPLAAIEAEQCSTPAFDSCAHMLASPYDNGGSLGLTQSNDSSLIDLASNVADARTMPPGEVLEYFK